MVAFPPCKINLGLRVLQRRQDGYHDIDTCFYPVPWTDILEIIPASSFQFTLTGIPVTSDPEDNLCVKAYRLLQQEFAFGDVEMHLHKIIPSGAGLGGGSSDAASVLRLLNTVFKQSLSTETLQTYAARLGSDCAFFADPKPMIGSGRGEILEDIRLTLSGKFLVIVKPNIHVSTAEAYAYVVPKVPGVQVRQVVSKDIALWKDELINDFELSVFKQHPVLKSIKESLYRSGAVYASMSGSGAAMFGIFNHETDLRSTFSSMTYWASYL